MNLFRTCTLLLLCLATTAVTTEEKPDNINERPPNFIVFFVDDLGYGDLGFTGHPTTKTPNLDRLAWNGKILTTWYSGCNVCTGSRAALMTGRQFARTGLPGVIGPDCSYGLNLHEITIAEHLKREAGYATGMVGKWHLGQRQIYLPGNRGFDHYLGIPFSDDMGTAWESECPANAAPDETNPKVMEDPQPMDEEDWPTRHWYENMGFTDAKFRDQDLISKKKKNNNNNDPSSPQQNPDKGAKWLPLVHQEFNATTVLEQPVDFTTLAEKYSRFATDFLERHRHKPFFLYVPFSHVHCTKTGTTTEKQYAGCDFKNATSRGTYGDALAETDWIAGTIVDKLRELDLEEDTLILFTSDNGPWMTMHLSGGSEGLFTGRFAQGYTNTAKGTTWEGGIREPAFAYWKGKINPFTRTSEVISSLDVFPTLSALAGIPLPDDRPYDGRDMSDLLLIEDATSPHEFLFFYGTCSGEPYWSISSVRHGSYKAHWCTAPGLGPYNRTELTKRYDPPLLFNIEKDPSEAEPISYNAMPKKPGDYEAMQRILKAYAMEKATFRFGNITQEPDGPGEGPGRYALCCDRSRDCYCKDDNDNENGNVGIFHLGTKEHHDEYHKALGKDEPHTPQTAHQRMLRNLE